MKKTCVAFAILALASVASATGIHSDSHDTYNQPTAQAGAVAAAAALGVGIGQGGAATAAGGAGGQGGAGGSAAGGTATALGGNGSGNRTEVKVQGAERSAPSVYVNAGTPLQNGCRYVFGVGASSPGGAGSAAGIPLWKDSECKGGAALRAMDGNGFTQADRQRVICENFDAAAETDTCKTLKQTERNATAQRPMPWQAGG